MPQNTPIDLDLIPNLHAALSRRTVIRGPRNSDWRWRTGRLPGLVLFLLHNPDLAEALAADAKILADHALAEQAA